MANNKKNIEFDLFRPYYTQTDLNGITKEHVYNLSYFLQYIAGKSFAETKKKIYGDNHMFHKCVYDEREKIWEIQILHLREQILPGIADESGMKYELIHLDENQYPAESTTAIYDEQKCILYVQRNIYGTSIRALTALIQSISPEETWVDLKPIMSSSAIEKITEEKYYRKVTLTVDSEQLIGRENDTRLGRIISAFSQYSGKIVTINLGFGRKRNVFLNKIDTIELLKEAYAFPGTEKLIATMSESEDGKCESIDLLDDREKILFELPYSRENPITHDRLFSICSKMINSL